MDKIRYKPTEGHLFAYREDAEEHQQYIDRLQMIDDLVKAKHKTCLLIT